MDVTRPAVGSQSPWLNRANGQTRHYSKPTQLTDMPSSSQLQFGPDSSRINCLLIGNPAVGKSSLVVSYTMNDYPADHCPTALASYAVKIQVDGVPVHLSIHDTGGSDEVESLRRLAYANVHVILLCFSVVDPESFRALRSRWLAELSNSVRLNVQASVTLSRLRGESSLKRSRSRGFSQPPRCGPAFILVGCCCDLRSDINCIFKLRQSDEHPVDEKIAETLAMELGAEAYIECSSLTQKNLKKVFDLAIWCGMKIRNAGGPVPLAIPEAGLPSNGTAPDSSKSSPGKRSKSLWRRLFCAT